MLKASSGFSWQWNKIQIPCRGPAHCMPCPNQPTALHLCPNRCLYPATQAWSLWLVQSFPPDSVHLVPVTLKIPRILEYTPFIFFIALCSVRDFCFLFLVVVVGEQRLIVYSRLDLNSLCTSHWSLTHCEPPASAPECSDCR